MTPAHPFWLLSLAVPDGGATPFTAWMLWHFHCLRPVNRLPA